MQEEDKYLDFVVRHYQRGKLDTRKAYRDFRNKYAVQLPAHNPWRKYAAVAAVVLVVSLLAGGLFRWARPADEWVVLTAGNSAKEVVLPDSTVVTLAPESSIRYDAATYADKRNVEMQGKAFFQVKRNPEFPFSVSNDQAVVRVLGTKFQLSQSGQATEVWVESGKVSFASLKSREGVILTGGMSAVLAGDALKPEFTEQQTPNPTTWKSGYFVYENTPLEVVLKELSAYYGVKLSTAQASMSLTGRFPAGNLDEIIEIIESALGIKIKKSFNQ